MKKMLSYYVWRALRPWIVLDLERAPFGGWEFRVKVFGELVLTYKISEAKVLEEVETKVRAERRKQMVPPPTVTWSSTGADEVARYLRDRRVV
jgi:hypothetical protein